MTNKISSRDLESLSAYLDGELSLKANQRLEARLESEPQLRSALEDLRRTRTLIRSAPALRAPRNFTLTPQMAGVRDGRSASTSAFAMMRLASVLAVIFLVVAVVGELYAGSRQPVTMQVAQDVQPAPEFAPGLGGGGGGADESVESFAVPRESPALELESQASSEAPLEQVPEAAVEAAVPTSLPDRVEKSAPMPTPYPPPEPVREAPARGWSFMRLLQISLALVAIIAGAAAFFLRRSMRAP
jgi:anti-sigma factor RsiW